MEQTATRFSTNQEVLSVFKLEAWIDIRWASVPNTAERFTAAGSTKCPEQDLVMNVALL